MKALSIKQPWLYAITDLDKRIENRIWKPPEKIIGQKIALHAAKYDDLEAYSLVFKITHVRLLPSDLHRSAIIATAIIKGYIEQSNDKWFLGPYGWILDNIKVLSEPVFCRGNQKLWSIPSDVMALIKMNT